MDAQAIESSARRLSGITAPPTFDLPPNESCTGSVQCGEFLLDFACVSVAGTYVKRDGDAPLYSQYKTNQDSFLFNTNVNEDPNLHLFMVLDGHGANGHVISKYAASTLSSYLAAHYDELRANPSTVLTEAFLETDRRVMAGDAGADPRLSGTTCVVCLVHNTTLYVANCGDSRCVLGQGPTPDNSAESAIDLSVDHKPSLPEEQARIEAHNGRVAPLPSWPDGPKRVWLQFQRHPGLAMSRSIGDQIAHTVGVIAAPEIVTHTLSSNDRLLVLASDGVWEFISSGEAIDLATTMPTPKSVAELLCKESVERWAKEEPVCDDITVIAIMIHA